MIVDEMVYEPAAVGLGDDTWVAFTAASSRGSISLVRIGPSGLPVEPSYTISRTPNGVPSHPYGIVASGPDIVAAWKPALRVQMMVIAPNAAP